MQTLTATAVRRAFRQALDATEEGNVIAVTRYKGPWVVMLPVDRYRQFIADERRTLEQSERLEHAFGTTPIASEDSERRLPDK